MCGKTFMTMVMDPHTTKSGLQYFIYVVNGVNPKRKEFPLDKLSSVEKLRKIMFSSYYDLMMMILIETHKNLCQGASYLSFKLT